jgi:hypothetical protein
MTHPGTQPLPTPIQRRRGGGLAGHGRPRRSARPPRWPRRGHHAAAHAGEPAPAAAR